MKRNTKSVLFIIVGAVLTILFITVFVYFESFESRITKERDAHVGQGMLFLHIPAYTELLSLESGGFKEGSYCYKGRSPDGSAEIMNLAVPDDRKEYENVRAYIGRFIPERVMENSRVSKIVSNSEISASLGYPSYDVRFETVSEEGMTEGKGIVALSDNMSFYFGFCCDARYYKENQEYFLEAMNSIELVEWSG